jgi:hypothetical protein
MSGDLVSLRLFLVSAAPPHHDLWREGAVQASVPIEFKAVDAPPPKSGCAVAVWISASWMARSMRPSGPR